MERPADQRDRSIDLERALLVLEASVGVPPMQYLLTWRMALAKKMTGAGASISDAAFACGNKSASSFSVAFGRSVVCSPSHLRQVVHEAR